jgi:integrase
MEKRIKERKMNNRGTYSTTSTNRRLTIIRCCIAEAIKHGLMNKDKVLNPDPEQSANYGWKNLKVAKVKDKHALTIEEENLVIDKANELGDEEFAHAFKWLIDVGMRYETEFITFTIKDINWRNKTISFFRGKTNEQSVNIPLTKRALEIANRYKDVALTRQSQRMFSFSKHKIEAMFKKYRELCKIEDFTPYITRTTFGTRLGERGVLPKVIAKLMGHTCTETAQKYYVQATDKGLERAIKMTELSDEEFDNLLENQNSMIGHNRR